LENKSEFERLATVWPRASARALNKLNSQVFTLSKKTIRERYNAPASRLTARFRLAKATPENLAVGIHATGRPLALAYFGARPQKAGVSLQAARGRRVLMRGKFVQTMGSGHKGVFRRGMDAPRRIKRISPTTGKSYQSHMPIVEHMTISVGEMMIGSKVASRIDQFVNDRLPEILAHEIDFEASK